MRAPHCNNMLPSTRRAAKHSLAIPPPCTGASKSAPAAVTAAKSGRKRCVEALPCLPCGRSQCHRQAGRRCLPTGTDHCHGQSPVAPPGSGGCAPPCAEQPEGHAKVLIFYFARRIFKILTLPVGRKPAHRRQADTMQDNKTQGANSRETSHAAVCTPWRFGRRTAL